MGSSLRDDDKEIVQIIAKAIYNMLRQNGSCRKNMWNEELESMDCRMDVYAWYAPNGDIHVSTSINQKFRKGDGKV